MLRPGKALGEAHWSPFAPRAQHDLLFVRFCCIVASLSTALAHLPASEAWRALAFSWSGPLNLEAPFNGAGWACPRKTSQDSQEPVWNSK